MSANSTNCNKCGKYLEQPMPCPECEPSSSFAAPAGWTADQQLKILCETLRNITNGTTHLHEGNYDHAALDMECAAGKLRLLERCRQSNTRIS